MELLISKDMYKIPIPLLIRNDSLSFNCENFIRGYHMYMKVWSRLFGDYLIKKGPSKRVYNNAVTMTCLNSCGREEVVGDVSQNILKVVPLYLFLPHCYLELEVTGKRVNQEEGYGLETMAWVCFYGSEKNNKNGRTIKKA